MEAELKLLRAENAALKEQLASLSFSPQAVCATPETKWSRSPAGGFGSPVQAVGVLGWHGADAHGLDASSIQRYSRHLALPQFGPAAQGALLKARVLLVGAGGLGSSAALYLAAAGVGSLSIADSDTIEESNLHRQVIHSEAGVGQSKAMSAVTACMRLNSKLRAAPLPAATPSNVAELVSSHSIVLDCSDNVATRFMLSDAAAACGIPLISGASVGFEGQVMVLCGNRDARAPCYRCLFPAAPAAGACARCADAGVLGVIPGIIGCLQALEAIKAITGVGESLRGRMLVLDALSPRLFFSVQTKPWDRDCPCCGTEPRRCFSLASLASYDYADFAAGGSGMSSGGGASSTAVPPAPAPASPAASDSTHVWKRVRATDLVAAVATDPSSLIVDVRPKHQYAVAALKGSLSVPLEPRASFAERASEAIRAAPQRESSPFADGASPPRPRSPLGPPPASPADRASSGVDVAGGDAAADGRRVGPSTLSQGIYVICRRGNASQVAAAALAEAGYRDVCDIIGGLASWREEADAGFPLF